MLFLKEFTLISDTGVGTSLGERALPGSAFTWEERPAVLVPYFSS